MEMEVTDEQSESTIENVQSMDEPIEPSPTVEPYNLTMTSTINLKDPLVLSLEIEEKYGLKPCFVELERCDKIWETLQLIRDLQEDINSDDSDDDQTNNACDDDDDDDEPASSINDNESYSSTQANPIAPYIQYEPVLNNGNTALPNFQFSVKSTRLLYQCFTCGKQYSHRQTLRDHSEKVHNIIIPSIRNNRADNNTPENKNSESKSNVEDKKEVEVNRDDSNASPESVENDGQLLDSASETQLSEKDLPNSKSKKFPCHLCSRGYNRRGHLSRHLKSIHEKQETVRHNLNVHRCNICGKHFYNSSTKHQHSRTVHGIYVRKPRGNTSHHESTKDKVKREKSTKPSPSSTKSNAKNAQHQRNNKTKRQPTANLSTKSKSATKKSQTSQEGVQCNVCHENYPDRNSWLNHCMQEHKIERGLRRERLDKKCKCKKCGRQYSSYAPLITHLWKIHGIPLLFECRTCGLRFKDADSVIHHAADEHKIIILTSSQNYAPGNKAFQCSICEKFYSRNAHLKVHMWTNHGVEMQSTINNQYQWPKERYERCKMRYGMKQEPVENSQETTTPKSLSRAKQSRSSFRWNTNASEISRSSRRSLRETTRVNYDENFPFPDSRLNSRYSQIKTEIPEEIKPTAPSISYKNHDKLNAVSMDILCLLCGKRCKLIRKHLVQYHKIRRPDALIAQCRRVLPTDYVPETETKDKPTINRNTKKTQDNIQPTKAIKGIIPIQYAKKRVPFGIELSELWTWKIAKNNVRTYTCKACPEFHCSKWRALQLHEAQFHPEHFKPNSHVGILRSSTTESRKRKRESMDNRETRRRRLSDSLTTGEIRTTRATTKLKEMSEHRCFVCYRLFRNAEILSSHKISCILPPEPVPVIDGSDTRESSDRDSGIGISITIKKKNNSYEIVSRDGSDERGGDGRKSQGSETTGEYSKYEISSSDASLDTFPMKTNRKISKLTNTFQYSKDHEVIKMQKIEVDDVDVDIDVDVDVDIDLESVDPSPVNTANENGDEAMDVPVDVESVESKNETSNEAAPCEILPLTRLCERVLAQASEYLESPAKDDLPYKCRFCPKMWASCQSLASHTKVHKRGSS